MPPQQQKRKPRSGSVYHTVRTADGRYRELRLTRKVAMAAFCSECMGFEENPADCTSKLCPLYPFRAKTLETRRGTMDHPQPNIESETSQEDKSE